MVVDICVVLEVSGHKMRSLFWVACMFLLVSGTARTDVQIKNFKRASGFNYIGTPLGEPHRAASLADCARICLNKNYSDFVSVAYISATGECIPGSSLSYNASNTIRSDGYLLFSSGTCDKSFGFRMYTYKSVTLCLFVSETSTSFTSARAICTAKGSLLYMIKSQDKFDLLLKIFLNVTFTKIWVGLSDMAVTGQYKWEDDTTSPPGYPIPWVSGMPDDYKGLEHCAMCDKDNCYLLNDDVCSNAYNYICEKETSP